MVSFPACQPAGRSFVKRSGRCTTRWEGQCGCRFWQSRYCSCPPCRVTRGAGMGTPASEPASSSASGRLGGAHIPTGTTRHRPTPILHHPSSFRSRRCTSSQSPRRQRPRSRTGTTVRARRPTTRMFRRAPRPGSRCRQGRSREEFTVPSVAPCSRQRSACRGSDRAQPGLGAQR